MTRFCDGQFFNLLFYFRLRSSALKLPAALEATPLSACPWPGPPTARPSSQATPTTSSASGRCPSPPDKKGRRGATTKTCVYDVLLGSRTSTSVFRLYNKPPRHKNPSLFISHRSGSQMSPLASHDPFCMAPLVVLAVPSVLCCWRFSRVTPRWRVAALVAPRFTLGAAPARRASSQREAHRHQLRKGYNIGQ